jgi:hypothetical protein
MLSEVESSFKIIDSLRKVESSENLIGDITDIVYEWCFEHLGADHIINAQQEFQHLTGKFFSDDDFYRVRIKYFIEYFLFDRLEKFKFLSHLTCPIYAFYESISLRGLSGDFQHRLYELKNNYHSLYGVLEFDGKVLVIKDLLTNTPFTIKINPTDHQIFSGIEKFDIFQCHIFRVDHSFLISDGLILHSRKARNAINEVAKKYRNSPSTPKLHFLFHLANAQLMMIRRPSVSAQYAYQTIK